MVCNSTDINKNTTTYTDSNAVPALVQLQKVAVLIPVNGICNWLLEAGTTYPSKAPGFTTGFLWVCFAYLIFWSCVCVFVCVPFSCVSNVASVSGLSILDCPFGFL